MSDLRRRTLLLGGIGLAGATAAACTGPNPTASSAPASSSVPSSSPSPSPSASEPVDATPRWPLTGRKLDNPDDAKHIAVAVKVPDNKNEHPQMGLDKADIVYVEMDGYPPVVGQTSTRLVPIFHTHLPEAVNPVRSIRPVDIPMLSPITAIIGSTGAYKWVQEYADEFPDFLVSNKFYMAAKGTGAYGIISSRVRVLNGKTYYDRAVLCNPKRLATLTKKFAAGPQQSYFPWAASADEVSTAVAGKPAKTISVPWKQGNTYNMTYTWSSSAKRYLRSMPWGPHVLAGGIRVACDNVLVIRAKQLFGKINKAGKIWVGGHLEPIHQIIDAKGSFYYAHGGSYVTGTWSNGAVDEVFQFTLADGSPLKMAPGQTYVELPNSNAKVVIKG